MFYKLVSLSNDGSRGNVEVGNTKRFYFDGIKFEFGSIRSSRVSKITIADNEMVVSTKNSIYFFEKDYKYSEAQL